METCVTETTSMVESTLTLVANIVMLGATRVATKTKTSVEIAGKHYEGGTKAGKMFLKAVKKFQTMNVDGVKPGASYVQKVKHKLAGDSDSLKETMERLDGATQATMEIAIRSVSNDFKSITSPEILEELSKRLSPENLRYVIREYSKLHISALSESDAWNLGLTIGGIVGMFDLTGLTSVVTSFAKPICVVAGELDYMDQKNDGEPCTKSIDCISNCCSSIDSGDTLTCAPLSIGFHPDSCIGPDPQRSLPDGSMCNDSQYCQSGCCQKTNDESPFRCKKYSDVRAYDSAVCLGSPARFAITQTGQSCESTLDCSSGCCTRKYSNGHQVCTPTVPGGDPVTNQCAGKLFADGEPCARSHSCQSGCCSKKYSQGILKCTPLGVPGWYDPVANECV